LEAELIAGGVPIFFAEKRGRWDVIGPVIRLVRRIRKAKPDVIYSFLILANITAILIRPFIAGVPVVWGIRASSMDLRNYGWAFRFVNWLESRLARYADRIIVNSHAGLISFSHAKGEAVRIEVIPNGIDCEKFRPDPRASKTLRDALRISEGDILIGLPARYDPMKDHATFFEAAGILGRVDEHVWFIAVGAGVDDANRVIGAQLDRLHLRQRVSLLGARLDMPQILAGLDVVTLCSAYGEGFPNVLGEAMACGVPCVATDVGDSSVVVGEFGIVVPPRNPAALAAAWQQLIARAQKGRTLLGYSSRERITREFSLERMIDRTECTLGAVTGRSLWAPSSPVQL
jgi:glycosyltransferase involved in cell wall biosynthesis